LRSRPWRLHSIRQEWQVTVKLSLSSTANEPMMDLRDLHGLGCADWIQPWSVLQHRPGLFLNNL